MIHPVRPDEYCRTGVVAFFICPIRMVLAASNSNHSEVMGNIPPDLVPIAALINTPVLMSHPGAPLGR